VRLFILALGTFAIGTEGFVIAGVLPLIATDLRVSVAAAGQLVTLFALAYGIAAPVMATLTASVPRRALLVTAMTVFTAANVGAALAPSYLWLALARVLAAVSAAAYTPAAGAVAAMTADPAQRGRALATVTGGLSVATVIGVPVGTWIGSSYGWRMTFVFVAVLATAAVTGIAATLPATQTPAFVSFRDRLAMLRRGAVLAAFAITTCWMTGIYVLYTYIAPVLHLTAGVTERELSVLLLIFGGCGVAGTWLGGLGADRLGVTRTSVPALIVIGFVLVALPVLATTPLRAALLMGLWGLGWAFVPAQQHRLVSLTPATPAVILSFNASALYLGVGLGAGIGGLLLDAVPLSVLGVVGCAFEVAALVLVLTLGSQRRRRYP
jgi:MFS transporter, DHA1 family, inner membrane transport protein